MQFLYSLLFYLSLPYLFWRLWRKSLRLPAYRTRFKERFGFYPFRLKKSIWVHAVSVGEAIASIPLIKTLQTTFPTQEILVTTMTPTGYARIRESLGDQVKHLYLPYDFPFAVNQFLKAIDPQIAIIMETELWPNLLTACRKKSIPVCLMNARLSERSAQGYQRIRSFTKKMLHCLTLVAAQGSEDAARFMRLGLPKERVQVCGNLKFDLVLPADLPTKSESLREKLGANRFVWVAASTHEGEEEIVLAAHALLLAHYPKACLILVPRHPDRFDKVVKTCAQQFKLARHSLQTIEKNTQVYLGDTMGELLLFYAAADLAFIGGSLIPHGGHNLLEPGLLGKALLSGPHLFNFAEISQLFFAADALVTVKDAATLAQAIETCMDASVRNARGERARQVVLANQGALTRQVALLSQVLKTEAYPLCKSSSSALANCKST